MRLLKAVTAMATVRRVHPNGRLAAQVVGFTSLTIAFAGTNGADIRLAQSSASNPTAYAYYPGSNEGGDVWFGTSYNYTNPKLGDYYYLTHIHELGHALGLKQGQSGGGVANVALPTDRLGAQYDEARRPEGSARRRRTVRVRHRVQRLWRRNALHLPGQRHLHRRHVLLSAIVRRAPGTVRQSARRLRRDIGMWPQQLRPGRGLHGRRRLLHACDVRGLHWSVRQPARWLRWHAGVRGQQLCPRRGV
jgi:hypothetical protein